MSTQTIIGVVRALNGLLEKVSAQGETHLVKSGAPLHQGDMLTLLSGEAYVQFINGFPEALSLEKPLKLDGISPALKFGALDGNAEIIQEAVAKGIDPSLILDILGATAAGIDTHGSSGEAFYMDPMYGAGLVSAGLDTLPISISNYISDYNPKGIVYVEPGDQSASNTSALPSTNLNTTPIFGSVTESGGSLSNPTVGVPSITGQLSGSGSFTPATFQDAYGKFSMDSTGKWSYDLYNDSAEVNSMQDGETKTVSLTVETSDGIPRQVQITIHGANDAAVIAGAISGDVTESGGFNDSIPGQPEYKGQLFAEDPDNPENTFRAVNDGQTDHGYGTFSINQNGEWVYHLDNNNPAVNSLKAGTNIEDTFTVYSADGTPQEITIVINGTNDITTLSLSASGSVDEGGSITYTATLSHAAQTPVIVTLSNGETITIAAGDTSGTVNVAAPGDDPYLDGSTVSAHITGASGGNFEDLAVDNTAVDTVITDTLDTTTLNLSASGSVAEGGVITYTATLSHAAQTP
ncbi:VCBS domain-containing protein, partial [Legionella shakespearei]